MHILIIENEEFFASSLARYLQKQLPVQCFQANTLQAALEYLKSTAVDLVISDLNLAASENGRHLLEIDKGYPGLRYVLISSLNYFPEELMFEKLHIIAYFEKPFEVADLATYIREHYARTLKSHTHTNQKGELYDA